MIIVDMVIQLNSRAIGRRPGMSRADGCSGSRLREFDHFVRWSRGAPLVHLGRFKHLPRLISKVGDRVTRRSEIRKFHKVALCQKGVKLVSDDFRNVGYSAPVSDFVTGHFEPVDAVPALQVSSKYLGDSHVVLVDAVWLGKSSVNNASRRSSAMMCAGLGSIHASGSLLRPSSQRRTR